MMTDDFASSHHQVVDHVPLTAHPKVPNYFLLIVQPWLSCISQLLCAHNFPNF